MTIRSKKRKREIQAEARRRKSRTGRKGQNKPPWKRHLTKGSHSKDAPVTDVTIETPQDLRIFQELKNNSEWEIPPEAFSKLPKSLLAMHANKTVKDSVRLSAANSVIKMNSDNAAAKKTAANLEFSVRRYAGRHTEAEDPKPDPETVEVTSAYRLQLSDNEAAEALSEMEALGLLPALFGTNGNGHQNGNGSINGHQNGNGNGHH